MRRALSATCVDAALAFVLLSLATSAAFHRLGLHIFG